MVRRRTVREIQEAAAILRRQGRRAQWAPIPDAIDLARAATRLRVYERPLPLGIRGLLAGVDTRHPALVINMRLAAVDRNLTAAHELGHWVLHAGATHVAGSRSDRQRHEWEADRFALELLLPAELVRRVVAGGCRSVGAAAVRLGVHRAYLLRRIRELRPADQPFLRSGRPVRGFSDTI